MDLLHYSCVAYQQTFADIAASLRSWNSRDQVGDRPDPEIEAARRRFHRKMARQRRRHTILPYIREPWTAWTGSDDGARTARRFLTRSPDADLPPPESDLLTDRQAAAEFHIEEEANDGPKSEIDRWR